MIDNFLAFNEFSMNLSYPKRIVKSYIRDEYIKGCPNFRYKKLIILLGANASGKTSLGQMLNRVLNFIVYRNPAILTEAIRDTNKEALLTLDFVISSENPELYRIGVRVQPSDREALPLLSAYVKKVHIMPRDSYEKAKIRLDIEKTEYEYNYVEKLQEIPTFGFFFSYPSDVKPTSVRNKNSEIYQRALEKTLKVLDPSIIGVERVKEARNSYIINFLDSSSVLIQEGKTVDTSLLSSGTKAGIAIADILTSIIEHENGFYYCDERFSYIQSSVECAVLGIMVKHLGDNEQIFFTTQNSDVLSLPYPKHSYMFLKKVVEEATARIRVLNADSYLKRNTDSLRKAVENDLFSIMPDIDILFEIERSAAR